MILRETSNANANIKKILVKFIKCIDFNLHESELQGKQNTQKK